MGCKYCKGETLDIWDEDGFYIYIQDNKLDLHYEGFEEGGDSEFEINFCPKCGRKLLTD